MGKIKDLTGQRFGRLIAIEFTGINDRHYALWRCQCDCGKDCVVSSDVLKRTGNHSCGCLAKEHLEEMSKKNITHGMTGTRLYRVYKGMHDRCYYPNSDRYNAYGGRGIKICDEWLHDKNSFFSWALQNGYQEDLTIERIDVNGDYCPENCKWIPMHEQYKNKQSNCSKLPEAYKGEKNNG